MSEATEGRRAVNPAAAAEFEQAFIARRDAYQAELEAAAASVVVLPEQAELAAARAALEAALEQRNRVVTALDDQIAHLSARRAELALQHQRVVDGVRARRNAAWAACTTAAKQLEAQVNARYPDMIDCWHASQWQRPEGV